MDQQPFKAVSIKQLEEAFAAAVSALTNLETTVTISMVKQAEWTPGNFKDKFELVMSLSSGMYYGKTDVAGLGELDDEIKF